MKDCSYEHLKGSQFKKPDKAPSKKGKLEQKSEKSVKPGDKRSRKDSFLERETQKDSFLELKKLVLSMKTSLDQITSNQARLPEQKSQRGSKSQNSRS